MRDQEDDLFTLLLMLVGVGAFGAFSLASLFAPVREWLVGVGVLVTGPEVLVPLGGEAGLDLARVAIAAGVLVILGVVAITMVVRLRKARRRV